MSLKTPRAVYTAGERQNTAAGEISVLQYLAMVFTSYGNRNKGIDTRIPKANAVLRELSYSVMKTGAFKYRKAFSF